MNSISRAIQTRKRLLSRPLLLLQSHFSTTATKPKTSTTYTVTKPRFKSKPPQPPPNPDLPAPTQVPFQPKVANSVRLIGHVRTPLQVVRTPDGKVLAATVLTSSCSSPGYTIRIPIVFEGDLAHTADLHLKDSDFVFVAGSLRSDLDNLSAAEDQARLQVLVHTLNFVEESYQLNKSSKADRQEERTTDHTAVVYDDRDQSWKKDLLAWKDLLAKPHEWWDIRLKEDPKAAAFERKNNGELLWISDKTPELILNKLDSLTFDQKPIPDSQKPETQKPISDTRETILRNDGDTTLGSWSDLLSNPKQWWDCRSKKLNGLVKPNYPDFKRKEGGHALWLEKAPKSVLSELEGLHFDVQIQKSKQVKESKGEDSWKNLVENPDKWWDNRLNKRNPKAPDFKHKETGEGLWLDSSPAWAQPKLPPSKTQ
ncbi:hypothetical protein C1H46_016043 [Malus baccata]|uniref:Uncharacterized protein n=1 Tax=Malus baccata TaxID=106549 RepID=A0A540MJT1_MALBA|nr:hypothetical protein C1H46_016043 [Malus baccata]